MNHIREIKKKRKMKKAIFTLIFIVIVLLIIKLYISINTALINGDIKVNTSEKTLEFNNISLMDILSYGIDDYTNALQTSEYKITIDEDNNVVFSEICQIKIEINNYSDEETYKIVYDDNEVYANSEETFLEYSLEEGKNTINVQLYKDDTLEKEEDLEVYYIEPYEEQFLDELTKVSVSTHYRTGKYEDYDSSVQLMSNLGVNYIRTDFFWGYIYINGKYDFSKYDVWVDSMKEDAPNVKILGILNSSASIVGEDKKIDTEEELNNFIEFCCNVVQHYPEIENYQILNEPNSVYVTDDDIIWYNRVIEEVSAAIKSINPEIEITQYSLSAGTNDSSTYLSSKTFYDKSLNNSIYMLSDYISYNVYYDLEAKIKNHKNQLNDFGGFIEQEITEYGVTETNGMTDDEQASQIIVQSVQIDSYDIDLKNLYNLWNTGTDTTVKTQNYGLLNNDYTPKLSYYAMKNYYENTNGAEYIGTVTLADGLEAHVYDKDGKAKIIAWSDNSDVTITIPYEGFIASDIYGEEIENTNGTLEITSSPVYLDDVSDSYFYEAISNTALLGYSEFEEKFAEEISNVEGLSEKIESLKSYMSSLNGVTTESEDVAKEKMAEHFNLGNMILEAYKDYDLNVEYVTLSSMLDMLNDIGNSYEDLLTVSAVTREPYYTATDELITSAEEVMEINSDLNITYPSKILGFAIELDEKSEYINSLEEENDIKTGLIVSNSLHAYYLADWANEFAKIYRDEYIEANPVEISYSTTEWTSNDVIATLEIKDDCTVTNNNGSNTYTFNENGTFTFEYERRGLTFTEKATVSKIDKTAPTITGVENGKIYVDTATFKVEDANISEVEVKFNDETMDYIDGEMTVSEEGIYTVTAIDEAGNTTIVEFYIIYSTSNNYIIKDNYILNITQKTTVSEFKEEFNKNIDYDIVRDDTILSDEDIVATGDTITLSEDLTYTIIVAGDINGDGKVSVYDYSMLRNYILKLREFDEIQLLAADINLDFNEIGIKDYTRMRIELLGIKQ